MKQNDEAIAGVMNERHGRLARAINADRPKHPAYNVSTSVWHRRPENSGTKLDSRLLGPAKVTKRIGEHIYEI
jgi:hypothetical protein